MKKLITALALAVSFSAQAENLFMIQESTTGTRWLIDVSSFIVKTDSSDPNSPLYIGSHFRYSTKGEMSQKFSFVTTATSCDVKGGVIATRSWNGTRWVTAETFKWSEGGPKMYDAAGEALCAIYETDKKQTPTLKKSGGITT